MIRRMSWPGKEERNKEDLMETPKRTVTTRARGDRDRRPWAMVDEIG